MTRPTPERTARCGYCGETFPVTNRSGPDPTYCSRAHRQAAYDQRRLSARSDAEQTMAEELTQLRSRVQWLEHDKQILTAERDDAIAEATRLRQHVDPPNDTVRRLTQPNAEPPPYPEAPERTSRRRWLPTRH
jgi:hypothetical protein